MANAVTAMRRGTFRGAMLMAGRHLRHPMVARHPRGRRLPPLAPVQAGREGVGGEYHREDETQKRAQEASHQAGIMHAQPR